MELKDPAIHKWILRQCALANIKLTGPRNIILDVILQSEDHPDVEVLHQRASSKDRRISLATVYRAVKLFQDAGLITKHDFGDGRARYEVAPKQHHDHLIDIVSGEVIEFSDEKIEALQEEVAKKLGFRLTGHRLELYGQKIKP